MSSLTRFLFTPVYRADNAWSIIQWWESRRWPYNLVLGVCGSFSIVAVGLLLAEPIFDIPWPGVVIYAFMANVCYTLGPIIDLFVRRQFGDRYAAVGPALFRYGFAFSIGLTLLPVPIAMMGFVVRVLSSGF
ncbi:MAG: hypothetical protein ACRENB_04535 [Gemmatimonadales bacterium]